MDINKHLEFIDPADYKKPIHIIGVGAVGSRIAEQLVRLGFDKIRIYDIDIVESINIPNQLYVQEDIGMDKVDALQRHLLRINPHLDLRLSDEKGYVGQPLSGAVFLSVDSIDLRRKIVQDNLFNTNIDVMFDGRMRLTDAQYYGAVWSKENDRKALEMSMQFSDEEAAIATPVSACNTTLSVVSTVVVLASLVVSQFVNFVNGKPVANMMLVDPFEGFLDSNYY